MIVFPNAKINIGLNILRKRPDNYHDIQSIFFPVPLYDLLEVVEENTIKDFKFINTGIKIDAPAEKNLVVRAYKQLKDEFNLPAVKIHLHKQIPFGAGLGGGSSDAAFMIKLLDKLFKLNLTSEKILELTKSIGADCSFFIRNKPAFVSGIGDKLEDINNFSLKNHKIILVKPDINLNTGKIYSLVEPKEKKFDLKNLFNIPIKEWKNMVFNDFEKVIFRQYPQIADLKQDLYKKGALFASMSGSGSSVFGIFNKNTIIEKKDFKELFFFETNKLI